MVPTNSFVDFFQDVLGFVFVDTLQVRYGEASLVQGVIQDRKSGCPLLDLLDLLDVLREAPVLKKRYDQRHPAICALDYKCWDFFDAGVLLDLHV